MQSHFVDPVPVEVPDEGFVPWVAEEEGGLGGAESPFVGSELVDAVEPLFGGAVKRKAVAAVAVEVSGQWDIAGVAKEESVVGDPLTTLT